MTATTGSAELLAALRKLAIRQGVRLASGGGDVPNGGRCVLCRAEWDEPFKDNEWHQSGCLLHEDARLAAKPAEEVRELDGWEYHKKPDGGDCRKIVTLDQDGMCWVGIRAFNASTGQWLNGGEPERASVLAWRDLDEPARGRWVGGNLILSHKEFSLEGTAFTLRECGCTEGFCDERTDGTCRALSTPGQPKP